MKPEKLFSVLYLTCIFLGFAHFHSQRQGFSSIDDARGKNMRKFLPKNNQTPNPQNFNVKKYLKSSPSARRNSFNGILDTKQLVNDALWKLIVYMRETNEGKIPMPDVSGTYGAAQCSFCTEDVLFTATQGSFSNLTSLCRRGTPRIRRRKERIVLSLSLGFNIAQVEYEKITVAHGSLEMVGSLAANLSPLMFNGQLTADYSEDPCVTTLNKLNVTRYGPISAVVSGMGFVTEAVESAIEDYIKNSNDEIRDLIISETSNIISTRLPYFDCEEYRSLLDVL